MRFEDVLPALRAGQSIQRASQPIPWAHLKRSPNGAFHWYGFGDDPERGSPMTIGAEELDADDWVIVDPGAAGARKPAGTFNCPRRGESWRSAPENTLLDYWRDNAHNTQDGKHSCSYCGSIHPDEFMQAVADGVEIGPTDKSYKAYMSGPGFSHAKFYFQHLSVEQKQRFVEIYNEGKMKVGFPGHFYSLPFFMRLIDAPAA